MKKVFVNPKGQGFIAASILGALLSLTACSPEKPIHGIFPGLQGDWVGYIEESSDSKLLTVLRMELDDAGGYLVFVLSPMQTPQALPGKLISWTEKTLQFSFKDLKASYKAESGADGKTMAGTWSQSGKKFTLNLRKSDAPYTFARPQEPKPPYGYESVQIEFPNEKAGIFLSGTLTYPKGGKAKAGIVLISGSGAQNRDEELLGHKPFLVLSDRLTKAGYAVLRYDDRGTSKSGGDFAAASTYDFLSDAQAAVSALRARKEIKISSCGALGHSEGGLIAALMAGDQALLRDDSALLRKDSASAGTASEEGGIDFAIIMAGPAFPGDQLLLQQSEAILKSQGQGGLAITSARKANEKIYGIIKSKPLGPELRKELKRALLAVGVFGKNGDAQLKALLTPWFKSFLEIDPAPSIRSARVPLLALYGSRDIQVPAPANPDKMKADIASSRQPRSKVVVLEGLNHLFQRAEKGTLDEYGTIEETMNERLFTELIGWLNGLG